MSLNGTAYLPLFKSDSLEPASSDKLPNPLPINSRGYISADKYASGNMEVFGYDQRMVYRFHNQQGAFIYEVRIDPDYTFEADANRLTSIEAKIKKNVVTDVADFVASPASNTSKVQKTNMDTGAVTTATNTLVPANATNTGLMTPAQKIKLDNLSNVDNTIFQHVQDSVNSLLPSIAQINARIEELQSIIGAIEKEVEGATEFITGLDVEEAADAVRLRFQKENVLDPSISYTETATLPAASNSYAGVMDSAMFGAFTLHGQEIDALKSAVSGMPRIAVAVGLSSPPGPGDIGNAFIRAMGSAANPGDRLVDISNNIVYILDNLSNWQILDLDVPFGLADSSNAGIVQHDAEEGNVSYFVPGIGQVNGWSRVKSDIADLISYSACSLQKDKELALSYNALSLKADAISYSASLKMAKIQAPFDTSRYLVTGDNGTLPLTYFAHGDFKNELEAKLPVIENSLHTLAASVDGMEALLLKVKVSDDAAIGMRHQARIDMENQAHINMEGIAGVSMADGAYINMLGATYMVMQGGAHLSMADGARFGSFGYGGWCGLNGDFEEPYFPDLIELDGNSRIYRINQSVNISELLIDPGNFHKFRSGDIFYFLKNYGENYSLSWVNAGTGMTESFNDFTAGAVKQLMFISLNKNLGTTGYRTAWFLPIGPNVTQI
jgi:hypothetical protein